MLTWNRLRTQPWGPFRLGTVEEEKASTPERGVCLVVLPSTEEAGAGVDAGGVEELVWVTVGGLPGVSPPSGVLGGVGTSVTTVFEVSVIGRPSPVGGLA